MLQLGAQKPVGLLIGRRKAGMAKCHSIAKGFVNKEGLSNSPAAVDCHKLRTISLIQAIQLFDFFFPSDQREGQSG